MSSPLILPGNMNDPRMLAAQRLPDPDILLRQFEEAIQQVAKTNWDQEPNVVTLLRFRDELIRGGLPVATAQAIVEKFQVQVSPTFVNHPRFPKIIEHGAAGVVGFFNELVSKGFTTEGAINQVTQRFSLTVPL